MISNELAEKLASFVDAELCSSIESVQRGDINERDVYSPSLAAGGSR